MVPFFCWLLAAMVLAGGCDRSGSSANGKASGTSAAELAAAGLTNKSYPLGLAGALWLTFPVTWKVEDQQVVERAPDRTSTFNGLKFTPMNSEPCAFLIELLPVDTNKPGPDLKAMAKAQIPPAWSNSMPEIKDLKGTGTEGWYFQLTDPRPTLPPGEFRFVTEGFSRLGPLVLVFKLVNDDHASEARALEVIRTARITKP